MTVLNPDTFAAAMPAIEALCETPPDPEVRMVAYHYQGSSGRLYFKYKTTHTTTNANDFAYRLTSSPDAVSAALAHVLERTPAMHEPLCAQGGGFCEVRIDLGARAFDLLTSTRIPEEEWGATIAIEFAGKQGEGDPGEDAGIANIQAFFDCLTDALVGTVEVKFAGYGDTGNIDDISYFRRDGTAIAPPETMAPFVGTRDILDANGAFLRRAEGTHREPFQKLAYDVLFGLAVASEVDWVNNAGGYGQLTVDVARRRVTGEIVPMQEDYERVEWACGRVSVPSGAVRPIDAPETDGETPAP